MPPACVSDTTEKTVGNQHIFMPPSEEGGLDLLIHPKARLFVTMIYTNQDVCTKTPSDTFKNLQPHNSCKSHKK